MGHETEQSFSEIVSRLRRGDAVSLRLRDRPGAPEGNQNAKKDKDENNRSNTTIVSDIGRGAAYTIARHIRDNPELVQDVKDGEMSA